MHRYSFTGQFDGWSEMASLGRVSSPPQSGLPSGGVAGQFLAKATDAPYEVQWANPTAGVSGLGSHVPMVSGAWYNNSPYGVNGNDQPLLYNGQCIYLPVWFDVPKTISSMAVYIVSGGGSTNWVFGVSNSTNAGLPGTLLASVSFASFSTGIATGVLTAAVPAGWNYLSFTPIGTNGGGSNVGGFGNSGNYNAARMPVGFTSPTSNAPVVGWSASGNAPVSNPTVTAWNDQNGPARVPELWFKIA